MRHRSGIGGGLAALALLSSATSASAAPHAVKFALDGRFGQSTAPYFTAAFPSTSGYGAFLIVAARIRVAERFQLGLRAPLVLMRVEQPAGALYAEAAWANPELAASFEYPWRAGGWTIAAGADLRLGAPLAEHDSAQRAGRALRLANALEGFSEPALFTPGVLPLTPAGSVSLESPRWKLAASLALPVLFRVSNADSPPESHPHRVGFIPVLGLEARLKLWPWFSVVASPRLTAQAIAPADDQAGRIQLLAAGRVEFQLGDHVALAALLQAPLGGPLGGSTVAAGLGVEGAF